jgi:hypothetical protein
LPTAGDGHPPARRSTQLAKAIHDKGQPQIVYEVIAKRIIDAAKSGERDVDRLRGVGSAALGLRNDEKQAS